MNEPIRIAQVLNRMDSGGIEAIVQDYYRHIDHSKVQYDFYYANDSTIPQKDELIKADAGLFPVPDYSKAFAFHKALYDGFRKNRYSIVHVHLNAMSVFALFAAWRAGIPVRICHNHSTAHWSEGKVTLLKYILRPFNTLFANRYFACGKVAAKWMYGNWRLKHGKVKIIPNAIDTASFEYDADARRQLRMEFGIAEDTFVVGHVGRFKHQKNHPYLLEVFRDLLAEKPDAMLLLVGEGGKMDEIRNMVEAMGISGNVIFAGVRKDVNKVYSAMDVFCLPSYYEGMPLVAWEAQSNGLPCVFADGVTREAAVKENAVFVSLENRSEWVKAMLNGVRDGEKVTDLIDINKCRKDLEEFYLENDALARRKCGRK